MACVDCAQGGHVSVKEIDWIDWNRIWADQREFNLQVREFPKTAQDRNRLMQYLALCMHSEIDEIMRAIEWREHRRVRTPENPARVKEELIDVFKYWVSMCQLYDVSPDEVERTYWRKSAVVRQLCDYITGFCRWLEKAIPSISAARLNRIREERVWISAETLGAGKIDYEAIKHKFRISGYWDFLPVMEGSKEFLRLCMLAGLKVVLLTSRPIDRYPNILTDTIHWLSLHDLPYDFIWWATDKRKALIERGSLANLVFAVDDDLHFVKQFDSLGISTFWVKNHNRDDLTALEMLPNTTMVTSVMDIDVAKEMEKWYAR
jgi:NTP pyrophosphatase (non-canonical NTP hydrolase)